LNTENTQYLLNTYPDLYAKHVLPMTQTCMCWGFDTGDGWLDLLDKLSAELQAYADKHGVEIRAEQVKEKYGTLRFYVDDTTDEVQAIIDKYEILSETTCEVCGEAGKLYTDGWYSVRCDEHKPTQADEPLILRDALDVMFGSLDDLEERSLDAD